MKYIASCSGGKDSVASIILAHENNEPLDKIIFVEVMFDESISGELPEHIDFVKNKLKPLCESWGYEFEILHSDKTFMDFFNHRITRSKHVDRIGKRLGFPMQNHCGVNQKCKKRAIDKFTKENKDVIYYVGIAADEKIRLERLNDKSVSLLEKYNVAEKDAYNLCEKYNLLSPIYKNAFRGGCWFCPNAKNDELKYLRKNYNHLWQKLLLLEEEKDCVNPIWRNLAKVSIHDKEKQFAAEEKQQFLFEELK